MEFDGIWIDMNEPASFTAGRPDKNGFNQGINGKYQLLWSGFVGYSNFRSDFFIFLEF